MAFEVATYTDVVASEAVDGVDGFNFQAVTPGLTGVDQQRIRESLLHQIVPSWALEHDALSHPPTCAYIVQDGRFYLSRGESTGTTNSGRPGNQVTQAIVTSDPDDFVPYRPAQLYGATGWTLEKAPNLTMDPWVTPLEIQPEFEVAALEEFVTSDNWASAVLPHYLTMLDAAIAAEPKKLVLLHHDLDVVMRWIALGSLLVDTDTARLLQFRALVEDPWRADAALVGVSPAFGRGDLGAANVLDIVQRTMPNVEPSESARVRATWFLEQGSDDALNAIEIARRWEPALGSTLANEAASVVGLPGATSVGPVAWRTAMSTIEQLAAAGLRDDLALYAEELCEAIFGYGPSAAEEFSLVGRAARKAHDLDLDEVSSGILAPTLEALAAVPANTESFTREVSGSDVPIRWDSVDAREAATAFVGELLNSAPTEALPDLFAAARVIAAPVAEERLNSAIGRVSELWLRDPALGRGTWHRWLAGHAVLAATTRQLLDELRGGDKASLTSLLRGDWDFIAAQSDDPDLRGWLKAGRLGRMQVRDREDQVSVMRVSPEAWRVVLAGSKLPAHAGLWASWITYYGLPADLTRTLSAAIGEVLDGVPGPDIEAGDWNPVMRSLIGCTDPDIAGFADGYARAHAAFRTSREEVRARPGARLDACLPYVAPLAPLFLSEIGWLLVNSTNSADGGKLLAAASPWGPHALRLYILTLARTNHGLRAVGDALRLRSDPDEELASAADEALAQIVESQPDLVDLARAQPRLRGEMEKYLRQQSRGHGTKRRLGGTFSRNKDK